MSAITDKIRSRGHWDVVIRPEPFVETRVDYADLDEILMRSAVRLRGWPVPYIDDRRPFLRGDDWIGQDIDAEIVSLYEAWRSFMSGQFNHLRAVSADWRVGDEATAIPDGFTAAIEVWEILFYLTEVFELSARLAMSTAGAERMTIEVGLNGLQGRALVVGQPGRVPFVSPPHSNTQGLTRRLVLSRDELVASGRQRAVDMARDFFLRFGWKPSVDQLAEHQREITERS